MSSIFFQFFYDDGHLRPFDPNKAMKLDTSRYEAPEVSTDSLIDFFLITPFALSELDLSDRALYPSFVKNFDEDADDPKLGVDDNLWQEQYTLLVEPAELKAWASQWPPTLEFLGEKKRREFLVKWRRYDEIVHHMQQLTEMAECATKHDVKIMLHVVWET